MHSFEIKRFEQKQSKNFKLWMIMLSRLIDKLLIVTSVSGSVDYKKFVVRLLVETQGIYIMLVYRR